MLGGITQKELAQAIDVGKSTISFIENGRSKPTYDQIERLVTSLRVNPDFIVRGEGEPLIGDNKLPGQMSGPDIPSAQSHATLLVSVAAQAGYATDYGQENLPHVKIPGVRNGDARVFEVAGESMLPHLFDGDFVACTRVDHPDEIRDGLIYVIVSRTQGIAVKHIRAHSNGLRLLPANMKGHQPHDLPLDEVRELWEVQIRITKHILSGAIERQLMGSSRRMDRLEAVVEKMLQMPVFNQE